MLMPYLPGARVLDLFAGSGALGIEALSRGAAKCVFCDSDRACCAVIKENLKNTGLSDRAEIICKDYARALKDFDEYTDFDIILLDPPYRKGLEVEAIKLALKLYLPAEGGVIVAEHAADDILPEKIRSFRLIKDKKYGTVGVAVYEEEREDE